MTTYTSKSTTVTWMERCWCCGRTNKVEPCADDCPELMSYCADCDTWNFAEFIEYMAGGGITTLSESRFNPATAYRLCMAHGKEEGARHA